MEPDTYFAIVVLIGLVPAVIARRKGRSFVAFWIFGMLLFIAALPVALMLKPDYDELARRERDAAEARERLRAGA